MTRPEQVQKSFHTGNTITFLHVAASLTLIRISSFFQSLALWSRTVKKIRHGVVSDPGFVLDPPDQLDLFALE